MNSRRLGIAWLVIAGLVVLAGHVEAELMLQPAELDVGDPYRLAFVTSTVRDATSSDIHDYNEFVQAAADSSPLAGLGQSWQAIGSTIAIDARDNTGTNLEVDGLGVPIHLVDGTLLATGNADLWDGELLSEIDVDEFGVEVPSFTNQRVWTGSRSDGTRPQLDTLGGSVPLNFSMQGRLDTSDSEWIRYFAETNNRHNRLYGISGVIIAVPEPTSLTIVLLAGCAGSLIAGIGTRSLSRTTRPRSPRPQLPDPQSPREANRGTRPR
jgi:hypothetical protein